eukprot:CAMPEP_0182432012 /NCGR_PEP_ID=MMETSP1167-20130531/53324_1 /TAXON_ID=2988 /ORGANISM="Mallomonas Sp, Strain CCMP3275" /LENGTH=421 /DNA_ID=CAMNT_0024619029 /DNA_START=196 /DNA_END=1461 /DNA_ORIENTATION=-
MRLWDLRHVNESDYRETLYGFSAAMKAVWDHQHPKNCSTAKFLISGGHAAGFGSQYHVEGSFLAIAMNLGRVLLPHPIFPHQWPFKNSFCREFHHTNFHCYYEPYSSCTYEDVIASYERGRPFTWRDRDIPLFDYTETGTLEDAMKRHEEKMQESVLRLKVGLIRSFEFPKSLLSIWKCSPKEYGHIDSQARAAWWLSVSSAFLLRPNARTLNKLDELRSFELSTSSTSIQREKGIETQREGPVVGVYVRHGDKHAEMKLLPFQTYADMIARLWRTGLVHSRYTDEELSKIDLNKNGTIFFGTEDPVALQEAVEWGQANNWTVLYTNLFKRDMVLAADQQRQRGAAEHHELEYLSMLLNMDYFLRCDAWIGTMRSNWCRTTDELRNTVAGKADLRNVDLTNGANMAYKGFSYDNKHAIRLV